MKCAIPPKLEESSKLIPGGDIVDNSMVETICVEEKKMFWYLCSCVKHITKAR